MAARIVYGQQELIRALHDGHRAITLCAGIYKIPIAPGVSFDRLGPVAVSVDGTRAEAEAHGMEFRDIFPEYKNSYAVDKRAPLYTVAAVSSGSYGSYSGSFTGSFKGFGGSLSGSWHGSFGGSFTYGSFAYGSFASFGSSGSLAGMSGSFAGSGISSSHAASSGSGMPEVILGYGIDLI